MGYDQEKTLSKYAGTPISSNGPSKRQIAAELERIRDIVSSLESIVEELSNRLAPLLSPSQPLPVSPCPKDPDILVPLAAVVSDVATQVARTNDRISDLLCRLEI